MTPDRRFLAVAEIRAETTPQGPVFSGYAARFNSMSENLGGFREIIRPGAFTRGLPGSDVRCLANHDPSRILGRNRANTLELKEDDNGLWFRCKAAPTSYALDLAQTIARGENDGSSFRFYVAEGGDRWNAPDPTGTVIRELTDIEIDDVSIGVTYPAYTAPEVSVRSTQRYHESRRDLAALGHATTPRLAHAIRRLRIAEALFRR